MRELESRASLHRISLAIDGGHNIFPEIAHFLMTGGFRVGFEQNGQLHVKFVDDYIGSITTLRGPNVIDRLVERPPRHDFGIVGRDILRNAQLGGARLFEGDSLEEIHPLGISRCRVAVLVPIDSDFQSPEELRWLRIATNLHYLTQDYFVRQHNVPIKIVKFGGTQESAPDAGVADAVVAVYRTGITAKNNHLRLLKDNTHIMESEAVLVASREFLKTHDHEGIVQDFIAKIRETTQNPEALIMPKKIPTRAEYVRGLRRWTDPIRRVVDAGTRIFAAVGAGLSIPGK